jgi:hypothetical protein
MHHHQRGLLDHDVRQLQQIGGHTFFTCNPEQEEEANWLGGCFLLPAPCMPKPPRCCWTAQ